MKTSYSLADKAPEVSIIPVGYAFMPFRVVRTFWDDIHRNRLKRYALRTLLCFSGGPVNNKTQFSQQPLLSGNG